MGCLGLTLLLCAALVLPARAILSTENVETQQENEVLSAPEVTYDPTDGLEGDPIPDSTAKAALLMDANTGTVLYAKEAHAQRAPASVTKIMTLLLVCEAIDAGQLTLEQTITASAHAAGMGGSQIYLEEGEEMTVEMLLKAVTVASANDAAVALGEAVAGSETAFVERMNRRAQELGMEDTQFVNCTGLPAEGHLTCAYDIALMSRALLEHELIFDFTGIWMDSLRDGAFQLTSTNKLLRTYNGCTGLKTGYTADAGFCMSATAQRDDLSLIAVVLGADNSKDRFSTAATLLDWGFAHFACVTVDAMAETLPELPVERGTQEQVALEGGSVTLLVQNGDQSALATGLLLPEQLEAPVEQGQVVGWLTAQIGDDCAAVLPLTARESVGQLSFQLVFWRMAQKIFTGADIFSE
jgi:D-alanyl-D-alanine carboxypeptidase (penicillin-binding protein 5/6)